MWNPTANGDAWTPPESWLVLLEVDTTTHVDPADEPAIDVALTRHLESGCTRDELLHLTLSEGGPYRVRVSRICGWWINTPEHTRRNLMRTAAQRDADRELRSSLGLPWKEDDE